MYIKLNSFIETKFESRRISKELSKLLDDFYKDHNICGKEMFFWQDNFLLLVDLQERLEKKYGKYLANLITLLFLDKNINMKIINEAFIELAKVTSYIKRIIKPIKSNDPAEAYEQARTIFKALHKYNGRVPGSLPGENSSMLEAIFALRDKRNVGDCKTLSVLWQYFFSLGGIDSHLLNLVIYEDQHWQNEHVKLELELSFDRSIVWEPSNYEFSLGGMHQFAGEKPGLAQVTQYYEYKTERIDSFKGLLSYFILDEKADSEEDILNLYKFNNNLFITQQKLMLFYLSNTQYEEAYIYAEKIWQLNLDWLNKEIEIINNMENLGKKDRQIKIKEKEILFADFLQKTNVVDVLFRKYNELLMDYAYNVNYGEFTKEDYFELKKNIENLLAFLDIGFRGEIADLPKLIASFGQEFEKKYLGKINNDLLAKPINIKKIKQKYISIFKDYLEMISKQLPFKTNQKELLNFLIRLKEEQSR